MQLHDEVGINCKKGATPLFNSIRLFPFFLDNLWNAGVLPTTQFAYRKGLGTCDALLCVSLTLQSALERGQEARIVQIDFNAAFDRVNHLGILYL